MIAEFKIYLVFFCVFAYVSPQFYGYVSQAAGRCKPSRGCNEKGGKCYGPRDLIPDDADKLGMCGNACMCYKEASDTNITTSQPQTCGEKKKCQELKGLCLKEAPENYEFSGFFCKKKAKCKCFIPTRKEASARSPVCTVSGPDPGSRCQFPFTVGGKVYNDCKLKKDGKSYCSTKTKKNGKPVKNKWGYCGSCSEAVRTLPFTHTCSTELKENSTRAAGEHSSLFKRWENNIVPYQFSSSFSSSDRQAFLAAAKQIEDASCVSFQQRSGQQEYLYVKRESGCRCNSGPPCANGGYTNGHGAASPRLLVVEAVCLSVSDQSSIGFLVHEILHALGMIHEQRRPDRNENIQVNLGYILPSDQDQFDRCTWCPTFDTLYDCSSIMHYRDWGLLNPRLPYPQYTSMTSLKSGCDLKKENSVMTQSDKQAINKMYECAPTINTKAPTQNTCEGSCGGKAASGCYCDPSCSKYNDCCPDMKEKCEQPPKKCVCCNKCGKSVSAGGKTCYCDNVCANYGDCCEDKDEYC